MYIKDVLIFVTTFFANIFRLNSSNDIPHDTSPVILVPGNGQSPIEAKLNKHHSVGPLCQNQTEDYFRLYMDVKAFLPPHLFLDCWIDNMKLDYDNVTKKTSNTEGVDIRIPGWGDPLSVENIEGPSGGIFGKYFDLIADMLVNDLGLVRNVSLRGAPYDYRKAANELEDYFVRLKELIEQTYELNNNKKVTLIVHSMGGPMSLIFLNRQSQIWKDQHIKSLISLAGAWGGTVKSLRVFAIGDDLNIPGMSANRMRPLLRTFPSVGWLMPSKRFWRDDDVIANTQSKTYKFADLQQYLMDIGVPNAWEWYKDNEHYLANFTAPGVELHCLYGDNIPTVDSLTYKEEMSDASDNNVDLNLGPGDGVINVRSLESCTYWRDKQNQPVYNQVFPGIDHNKIVRDDKVLDYIKKVLEQP